MSNQSSTARLALLGGKPAFASLLHVGRPNIGSRDTFLARVRSICDSRWLTNHGPYVAELEEKIADLVGVSQCILVCNATIGLELLIRALNLKGEVIVPSFTFVATAHALQWQGITPVFADIDPKTHNLDPKSVETRITSRTTGIIGVHLWGQPCAVDSLAALASRSGLQLIYDAAHAFACSHKGRQVGTFGRAEVFSFHATKFINTLEGGAIVTNDGELGNKLRLMQNFGFQGYDNVIYIGTNGKMTEVSAAMGLTNLESIEAFIEHNRTNYSTYRERLANIPGMSMLSFDDDDELNYQYVVVEVDESETGLSRDSLVEVLHAENVIARRYFYPGVHRMEPYRSTYADAIAPLPVTERVCKRVLVLPTGTAVSVADVNLVCDLIAVAISEAASVRAKVGADRAIA